MVRVNVVTRTNSTGTKRRSTGGVRVNVVDKPKTSRQKTLETLKAEQQVIAVAEAKGGITRREFQRELAKRGVSVRELRRATAEGRARTAAGDDVFEETVRKGPVITPRQQTRGEVYGPRQRRAEDAFEVNVAPKRTVIERIKDVPNKVVERVTGKKPNQLFFEATGSQRTVVDKATPIVVASETLQVPKRVAERTGETFGILAERGSRKVIPEGVTIKMKGEEQKNVTIVEPQFGTITSESRRGLITRNITTQGRATRDVTIFEPKRIRQGVEFGTTLGASIAFPTVMAASFGAEGTETALDTTKTTQERALGVVEAGLSVGFLGFQAGRWLRTPVRRVTQIAAQKETETATVSVIKKVVDKTGKNKLRTFSRAEATGERGATFKVVETTKGRELFGIKPKKSFEIKPKETKLETLTAQVDNQPFYVEEFVEGKKSTTLLKVDPSQPKVVTANNYAGLTKKEKFLVKRLLEERLGLAVSDRTAPMHLKTRNVVINEAEVVEFGVPSKAGKTSLGFEPAKEGKRTQKVLSAEEMFFDDTEGLLKISSGVSVSKDVTMPGARAAGRTPVARGVTLTVGGKPGMPRELPDIFSPSGLALKPAKIKKTPITKTFPELLQQQGTTGSTLAAVMKARTPIQKIPKTKITPIEPTITENIAPSSFAGLGLYEQQPTVSMRNVPSTGKKDIIKPLDLTKSNVGQGQKDFFDTSTTNEIGSFTDSFTGTDTFTSSDTSSSTKITQASAQASAQQQLMRQSTTQTTTQSTTNIPRRPITTPILKLKTSVFPSMIKKVVKKKKVKGFIPQVKDKGKWVKASKKIHTRDEALRIASKVADKSTGVSIRAKPSKKKPVKPKSTRPFRSTKFRDYKISKGKRVPLPKNNLIEKKKYRIDTLGEKNKLSALAVIGKRRKPRRRK